MQIKRKKKKVPNSKPAAPLSSSMFFSFLLKTEKLKTHNSLEADFARLCLSNYASQLTFQSKAVPSHPAEMSQYVVSAARLWVVLKC